MDDITRQYIDRIMLNENHLSETKGEENILKLLAEKAHDLFSGCDDNYAIFLRNICVELNVKIQEKKRNNRILKDEISEFFNILDEAIPDLNWNK